MVTQTKEQFMAEKDAKLAEEQRIQSTTKAHQGSGTTVQTGKKVDLNVMVHPADLGMTSQNANYMMFESFTMRGGVGSSTSDMNFEGPHEFVCLPIPSGIGATYEQGWDQQEVGMVASGVQMAVETAMSSNRSLSSSVKELKDAGKSALGGGNAILGTVGKMIMGEAAAHALRAQEPHLSVTVQREAVNPLSRR